MSLRLVASITALALSPTAGFSDTINLRNSCDPWQHIPASDTFNSPIAALLQCTDDDGTWLAMQIMCFPDTAEIEFRYRPSYTIVAPISKTLDTEELTTVETIEIPVPATDAVVDPDVQEPTSALMPLGEKEMLFFDFPRLGVTSVVKYGFDSRDWSYREKEPLAPLFRSLITGNYADVSLLAMGITERLPLRGSTKAITPVVESCRIAKRDLERKAAELQQD